MTSNDARIYTNDRSGRRDVMDKNMIIDVAFKYIIENGLEEFSIAKLAAKLECTKSSIYNYFKSKDDLLNQMFVVKTMALAENIDLDGDPEEIIRQYAHNSIKNRDVFTFFHKYSHSTFINKETMCEVKKEMHMSKEVVNKYIDMYATASNLNPAIIEALIFGPIHGLIMRAATGSKISTEDIDKLVDHILSSIRKEENERNS